MLDLTKVFREIEGEGMGKMNMKKRDDLPLYTCLSGFSR